MSARLWLLAVVVFGSGCASMAGSGSMQGPQEPTARTSSGSANGNRSGSVVPPAVDSLLRQGESERRAGQFANATATLERAARIGPRVPAVWLELARLRFAEGEYGQAEQMARKARSLAPAGSLEREQATALIAELR